MLGRDNNIYKDPVLGEIMHNFRERKKCGMDEKENYIM
jgi:hypothetical protein